MLKLNLFQVIAKLTTVVIIIIIKYLHANFSILLDNTLLYVLIF